MTHPPHPLLLETLDAAVEEFAHETRFPVAFGGFNTGDLTSVTAFAGTRTRSLAGLRVQADRGLGGRAMSEHRARLTPDYANSGLITHDYDEQIGGEGLVTLLAVPVIVGGAVRAVLYGGSRGSRLAQAPRLSAGAAVARALAREIRVQDRVSEPRARATTHGAERNGALSLGRSAVSRDGSEALATELGDSRAAPVGIDGEALERLRCEHAELRSIAAAVSDEEVRERISALGDRLARLGTPDPSADAVHLSPREVDVLAHAALGATNVDIGRALQLAESTVKSYLRTAMSKLDVNTRHAAVAAARRLGILP
ncbi:response regulator transcription factor [Leucobacter chromiireducens]|uniref:response regulator transcription factor n=1 Tax=Leucobacter chromiireducens TaxID=283877 RepID=UPI000F63305A|nr:LuxR C-terminal-related transcriptional regulator [Leucobacter chromiireducens]